VSDWGASASVHVDILTIRGCAHADTATVLVHAARERLPDVVRVLVRTVQVRDLSHARELNFPGSPTVLINGIDVEPDPPRAPAFACRLYRTADGLSGTPELEQIVAALRAAIAQPG
jgi:hypothetical protein